MFGGDVALLNEVVNVGKTREVNVTCFGCCKVFWFLHVELRGVPHDHDGIFVKSLGNCDEWKCCGIFDDVGNANERHVGFAVDKNIAIAHIGVSRQNFHFL